MQMSRQAARAAAVVIALIAGQTVSAHPEDLQVWSWGPPQGDTEPLDTQYVQKIQIWMAEGGAGKSPEDAARDVCDEIHARQLAGEEEFWILFFGFGRGNAYFSNPFSNSERLHFDEGDELTGSYWDYNINFPQITPWLSSGVASMGTWIAAFITEFNEIKDEYDPVVANPTRFFFDNEVSTAPWIEGDGYDKRELPRIFNWIMDEEDRSGANPLVPGEAIYGWDGKTLKQLWDLASQPACDKTKDFDDVANRAWYVWYSEVCWQAVEAAMYEVAYGPLETAFGAKCNDYNASVVLDGAGMGPFGGDRKFHSECPSGKTWTPMEVTGSGQVQGPVFYTVHEAYFDTMPYWGADWDAATYQRHRDYMESCLNSTPHPDVEYPSSKTVVPWITLPGFPIDDYPNDGMFCGGEYTYDNAAYLKLLAMMRGKTVDELIVFAGDSTSLSDEWNEFHKLMSWAWGADVFTYSVTKGSTSSPPDNPLDYGIDDDLAVVAQFDNSLSKYVAAVEITYSTTFDDGPNVTTDFDIITETWSSSSSATAKMHLYNFSTPGWDQMETFTPGSSSATRSIRTKSVYPVASYTNVDGISNATVKVRLWQENSTAFTAHFDLAQVIKTGEAAIGMQEPTTANPASSIQAD